ncbi:MAG: hypothetical protein JXB32_12820, partial [Deltaproteobacteria bacterium]|nr:hypothetical protein [Deltaproteobacteria bacterium]
VPRPIGPHRLLQKPPPQQVHHEGWITTNLEYEEWGNFLGNPSLVEALLGRLRDRCHTVKIKGPTLRGQEG